MKELIVYGNLSFVTVLVALVWSTLSLRRSEMVNIPIPILVVLTAAWGIQLPDAFWDQVLKAVGG